MQPKHSFLPFQYLGMKTVHIGLVILLRSLRSVEFQTAYRKKKGNGQILSLVRKPGKLTPTSTQKHSRSSRQTTQYCWEVSNFSPYQSSGTSLPCCNLQAQPRFIEGGERGIKRGRGYDRGGRK